LSLARCPLGRAVDLPTPLALTLLALVGCICFAVIALVSIANCLMRRADQDRRRRLKVVASWCGVASFACAGLVLFFAQWVVLP
jgi:preprotein translocase subunit Sec61beta